ncbi:hypothetical protein C8T65DRAFT_306548 [Cerioporus squamosus]|nr:hypothetical protein C8T65DRAFT_306548 [Cerioporus squamosus]
MQECFHERWMTSGCLETRSHCAHRTSWTPSENDLNLLTSVLQGALTIATVARATVVCILGVYMHEHSDVEGNLFLSLALGLQPSDIPNLYGTTYTLRAPRRRLPMFFRQLSVLAACLLASSSLVHAHAVHRAPPSKTSETLDAVREAATSKEARESGGNLIYSVEYCTDPNFTGQCTMPEVTLETCMNIEDQAYMKSVSSFRVNDVCVYCELYSDQGCITDIFTVYAGTAVGDGGASTKTSSFNDILASYRCERRSRGWLAPNCPS